MGVRDFSGGPPLPDPSSASVRDSVQVIVIEDVSLTSIHPVCAPDGRRELLGCVAPEFRVEVDAFMIILVDADEVLDHSAGPLNPKA